MFAFRSLRNPQLCYLGDQEKEVKMTLCVKPTLLIGKGNVKGTGKFLGINLNALTGNSKVDSRISGLHLILIEMEWA